MSYCHKLFFYKLTVYLTVLEEHGLQEHDDVQTGNQMWCLVFTNDAMKT
jgi:hypothetical protein